MGFKARPVTTDPNQTGRPQGPSRPVSGRLSAREQQEWDDSMATAAACAASSSRDPKEEGQCTAPRCTRDRDGLLDVCTRHRNGANFL
jgi:hypothetical protein